MALRGTIWGSTGNQYIDSKIVWSATQSITGNYSDVTATLYYSRNNTGYETGGTWSGSITINGTKTSGSKYITITYNSNTVAMSATTRVYHDNNGTKSITISASGSISGTTLTSTSCSGYVTLDTIARASSLSLSVSSVNVGGTITANITRASSSFTHTVEFYINNTYYKSYSSVATSQSYPIPDSWASYMSSSSSCTAYCRITTYNGSTKIGDPVTKSFTVTIPDTSKFKPALGTISLDPVNITTSDGTSRNILVQNKNKINVSISGCSAGTGSGIKSYTFYAISGSTVLESKTVTNTSTSASTSFGPFSQTGDLKFRVAITDNRNRTTNNSGNEPTQKCHAYSAPSFSSFTAYRCDSNGNANNNEKYINCAFTVAYTQIVDTATNTNNITVKIFYKKSTSSSWTSAQNALSNSTTKTSTAIIKDSSGAMIIFGDDTTYSIRAQVVDNYSGSVYSSIITVFGASRILNITSDGTGIALGKMAEENNLFECKWPAKFDDDVTVPDNGGPILNGYSVETLGPGTTIPNGADLNQYITPGVFRSTSASVSETLANTPITSGGFRMIVEQIGSSDYIKQTIITRTTNCRTYKRYKNSSSWYDWQLVLTDGTIESYIKNYTSSYLPLSGGTLTGAIKLPGEKYYESNSVYGLDASNSDLINLNGLYFRDETGSAGEGINFYHGSGTWDTLYTSGGSLKFHSNRSASGSLSGKSIYTSANFRRGTCTLSSSSETTVTFSSAMGGAPTVILTPLTTSSGIIPGKVRSTSSSGFTAIIGGEAVSSAKFAYLAVYY